MAITLNDNIHYSVPKPADDRDVVYTSISNALSALDNVNFVRYTGQIVKVIVGGVAVPYWFRDGVADNQLIPFNSGVAIGSTAANPVSDTPVFYNTTNNELRQAGTATQLIGYSLDTLLASSNIIIALQANTNIGRLTR
jgi:hypothetical protein